MLPVVLFWFGITASVVYLPFSENPPDWGRSLAKTVPLASFALAAFLAGGPVLLVLALLASAVGDYALSRHGLRPFEIGLAAFGAAHLFYLTLFTFLSGRGPYMAFVDHPLLALFAAWVAISTEIWLVPFAGAALRWAVRGYVLIFTVMSLAALTLPLGPIAIGVTWFVAANVVLGYRNFRMEADNPLVGRAGWLLWGLYIAAQALILVGVIDLWLR